MKFGRVLLIAFWKTFYIILPLEIFNKNIMYSAILGGL